jgi:hypothetical protein
MLVRWRDEQAPLRSDHYRPSQKQLMDRPAFDWLSHGKTVSCQMRWVRTGEPV